jgi:FkbM family methyltransferase
MRLGRSLLTKSNFLNAKEMYQQGVTLGSLLMWPIRSRSSSDRPHVFTLRDGTSFLAPPEGLSFQLLWREIWVEEVYAQAGIHIAPEATVVDIGANLGLFSLWAASRCERGRVVAVEPSPRMADFAHRNAARNRRSNITVVQVACGGAEGRGVLYTPYGDEARNTLDAHSAGSPRALADVEVVTLKELFRRTNIEKCDLLKVDCEGSEYDILVKSPIEILDRIQQIALEYHPGFNEFDTPEKLEGFLKDHGFDVSDRPSDTPGYGYMYAKKLRMT